MLYKVKFILRRSKKVHFLFHHIKKMISKDARVKEKTINDRYKEYYKSTPAELFQNLSNNTSGKAVIFGWSSFDHVLAEGVVRKSLDVANFDLQIIADPSPNALRAYKLFGIDCLRSFNSFCPAPNLSEARKVLANFSTFSNLVDYKYEGVAVGKYVCSSVMRRLRKGRLDLIEHREDISLGLSLSLSFVRGAKALIQELSPKLVVLVDRGYSPFGEVFDICVESSVQVITWNVAHRDNTVMLKRYFQNNRSMHPCSLSKKSWEMLNNLSSNRKSDGMEYNERLQKELQESYESNEWYSEVGTQFGKVAHKGTELREQLGLDPRKKVAVIYSHIFWDATFFWGDDLFEDYEDWFIESVKCACSNSQVNWLIKVHPANIVKNFRDDVFQEPSEIKSLEKNIGKLPSHVRVIPADSNIMTSSILSLGDYCITVRGTVGIEAAMRGKTVLTAGTGRYDRLGFTTDFDSVGDYKDCLKNIQLLEVSEDKIQKIAAKYGYGVFISRPIKLEKFGLRFEQDNYATLKASVSAKTISELEKSREIRLISEWLLGVDEDILSV